MNWYIKLAKSKLKEVNLVGTIQQTDTGFVYVKISNDVIHGLFKLIDEEGIEEPPYFGKGEIGAHISLISDEELEKDVKIKEVGQEINFTLGEMFSTKPKGWEEMAKVYFVHVYSDEFKEFRKKYKLPASYQNKKNQYHITVAVKKAK